DRPSSAPWLDAETGRALERSLAAEQQAGSASHGGHSFGLAVRDPQIWLAIFVYFCHQLTIYTMIFFLPGIISASGQFSSFAVGLLSAMPWVAAALGASTLPRLARDSKRSRSLLCAGLLVMAAGLVSAAHASPGLALLSVCVAAAMFFVVQAIIFTFPASRLSGNALAGGLGLVNTCGLLGGFVGPTVVGAIEQATGDAKNGLTLLAVALAIAAVVALRLRHGGE
ncbi:MFS transporter, partial [Burkholderia gladioli]